MNPFQEFAFLCLCEGGWRGRQTDKRREKWFETEQANGGWYFIIEMLVRFGLFALFCVFFSCFIEQPFLSAPKIKKNPVCLWSCLTQALNQMSTNNYWIVRFDTLKGSKYQKLIIVSEQPKLEVSNLNHHKCWSHKEGIRKLFTGAGHCNHFPNHFILHVHDKVSINGLFFPLIFWLIFAFFLTE